MSIDREQGESVERRGQLPVNASPRLIVDGAFENEDDAVQHAFVGVERLQLAVRAQPAQKRGGTREIEEQQEQEQVESHNVTSWQRACDCVRGKASYHWRAVIAGSGHQNLPEPSSKHRRETRNRREMKHTRETGNETYKRNEHTREKKHARETKHTRGMKHTRETKHTRGTKHTREKKHTRGTKNKDQVRAITALARIDKLNPRP
jgi:hypothetical protein